MKLSEVGIYLTNCWRALDGTALWMVLWLKAAFIDASD